MQPTIHIKCRWAAPGSTQRRCIRATWGGQVETPSYPTQGQVHFDTYYNERHDSWEFRALLGIRATSGVGRSNDAMATSELLAPKVKLHYFNERQDSWNFTPLLDSSRPSHIFNNGPEWILIRMTPRPAGRPHFVDKPGDLPYVVF